MFIRKRLHKLEFYTKKQPPSFRQQLHYIALLFYIIIGIKEIMPYPILFVSDNSIEVDILHTSENIIFNNRIFLRKFMDQFFNLSPLGTFFCATTGCTVLCKAACTLDKMQVIIICPVNDICLADQTGIL